MWIETRKRQYRVYWRTTEGQKGYEPFASHNDAAAFIALSRRVGLDAARQHVSGPPPAEPLPTVQLAPTVAAALATMAACFHPVVGDRDMSQVPFTWLVAAFLAGCDGANKETVRGYRRDLANHITPYFGDVAIQDICPRPQPTPDGQDWPLPTIQEWRRYLETAPRRSALGKPIPGTRLAAKTQRNMQALLASVFTFAIRFEPQPLLDRNPCHSFKLIRPEPVEPLYLERALVRLLLAHIDPRMAPLVLFLIGTGARWGEAAALQVKDVQRDENGVPTRVFIHKTWKRIEAKTWSRGRTKTPAGRRRLTLSAPVAQVIGTAVVGKLDHEAVFTMPGGGMLHHANFCARYLRPAIAAATTALSAMPAHLRPHGLSAFPEVSPHAFRHTHAALLLSANCPLGEVQRRLGHADPTTTMRVYGHLLADVGVATLAVLDEWTEGLLASSSAVTAADSPDIDTPDDVDATLMLLDPEEDDEREVPRAA